jgi:hypothetical protein
MRAVVFALATALIGCPPPDPDPPPSDDLIVDAEGACANLRRIGCPEAQGSIGGLSCAVIIVRASALRPLPLACWTAAATVSEAKACGALRCIQ